MKQHQYKAIIKKVDNTVYTISKALSSVDEAVIRGSVIKAYDLIEKK